MVLAGLALAAVLVVSAKFSHTSARVVSRLEYAIVGSLPSSHGASSALTGVQTFAHRAVTASPMLPNSRDAVVAALQHGTAIEVDVASSADGKIFVSHGDDLQARGITGSEMLQSMPADQLNDDWLSLADLLILATRHPVPIIIDIKEYRTDADVIDLWATGLNAALATVDEAVVARLGLISLNARILRRVHARFAELAIGSESYSPLANYLAGFSLYSRSLAVVGETENTIADELGLIRCYWTVQSEDDVQRAIQLQPDWLLLDPRS